MRSEESDPLAEREYTSFFCIKLFDFSFAKIFPLICFVTFKKKNVSVFNSIEELNTETPTLVFILGPTKPLQAYG